MFSKFFLAASAASTLALSCAILPTAAQATPAPGVGAPADARVYFIEPKDGAVLPTTFHVKFGLSGMHVRPAGQDIFDRQSGHHHLIIDAPGIRQGDVIPFDLQHIHFGKGQTETDVTLPPGPHTLTLQLGDGAHGSYGPKLSATIHVTVAPNKAAN